MDSSLKNIRLYRKRYIPNENILLKHDTILLQNDNFIVTRWDALKPRPDIARGVSAYFIKEGIKVSKVYTHANEVLHWYCDIIDTEHEPDSPVYIFQDLLIDILVYENGMVKIMDLDEVADMLDIGKLDVKKASKALHTANKLLTDIYAGNFSNYKKIINDAEI